MSTTERNDRVVLRPEKRLLDTAKREIASKGLEGLDVRTLARESGTSTSQFHDLYQRQENLLAAVFDDGWIILERSISKRLFTPSPNVEAVVEAIIEGILDAFDEDRDSVSATVLIGVSTVGYPMRPRLKQTPSYKRFAEIVSGLTNELRKRLPANEVRDCLEILFGATVRRVLLLTPLYSSDPAQVFDREIFVRTMRRVTRSLLNPEPLPLRKLEPGDA